MEESFCLDENVIRQLPQGTIVSSTSQLNLSTWTTIVKIKTFLADGTPKNYFLKYAQLDAGRTMMRGEYYSMNELHSYMPASIPKPLGYGKFNAEGPSTYYILYDFIKFKEKDLDAEILCTKIVNLHRSSTSPKGKFGFHVRTCNGRTPQPTEWDDSWTSFFTKMITYIMAEDIKINGPWPEFERLGESITRVVIPRLIGVLERDGRYIKPCLIHGDLWEGNTGTSSETGELIMFDAGAYYAHNEMEIADWRCSHNKVHDDIYRETYLQMWNNGTIETDEEWDDRNRMYSVYYEIMFSVNHMRNNRGWEKRQL